MLFVTGTSIGEESVGRQKYVRTFDRCPDICVIQPRRRVDDGQRSIRPLGREMHLFEQSCEGLLWVVVHDRKNFAGLVQGQSNAEGKGRFTSPSFSGNQSDSWHKYGSQVVR